MFSEQVEAKKAEPRDSRTPSVIGGNAGMGRGMAAMQSPYAPGKSCCRYEHSAYVFYL